MTLFVLWYFVIYPVSSRHERNRYGQATKGIRWMPWHRMPMKDVVSCDKLRGAASRL